MIIITRMILLSQASRTTRQPVHHHRHRHEYYKQQRPHPWYGIGFARSDCGSPRHCPHCPGLVPIVRRPPSGPAWSSHHYCWAPCCLPNIIYRTSRWPWLGIPWCITMISPDSWRNWPMDIWHKIRVCMGMPIFVQYYKWGYVGNVVVVNISYMYVFTHFNIR